MIERTSDDRPRDRRSRGTDPPSTPTSLSSSGSPDAITSPAPYTSLSATEPPRPSNAATSRNRSPSPRIVTPHQSAKLGTASLTTRCSVCS